jgi:hypothetical protein
VSLEAIENLLAGRAAGARLIYNDNVEPRQQFLLLTKRLSNNSLDPVTCCRLATVLLGDCQTEPSNALIIAPAQHGKNFVAASGGFIKHAAESRRIKESVVFCEPVALAARQSWFVARRLGGRWAGYGVNRTRPLARRRFKISRPAFVAMRARKPCVRARLILLG